jgi:hypothetical protein
MADISIWQKTGHFYFALTDQKLMPECKNLCLQNSASSETIAQREEYGQHGLGRLPVATLLMQQFQWEWTFW